MKNEKGFTGQWGHGKTFKRILRQLQDTSGYFESTDIVGSFITLITLLILAVKIFARLL